MSDARRSASKFYCQRCHTPLAVVDSPNAAGTPYGYTYYRCPDCHREYSKPPGDAPLYYIAPIFWAIYAAQFHSPLSDGIAQAVLSIRGSGKPAMAQILCEDIRQALAKSVRTLPELPPIEPPPSDDEVWAFLKKLADELE